MIAEAEHTPVPSATIRVNTRQQTGTINPYLYGIGFESFAGAVNRGLDAQLLDGRSFTEEDVNHDGVSDKWLPVGWGKNVARIRRDGRNAFNGDYSQKIEILSYVDGEIGIKQGGIYIESGQRYCGYLYLRQAGLKQGDSIKIYLASGKEVYAEETIDAATVSAEWKKYSFTMLPNASSTEAEFRVTLAGQGFLWIDLVSLMPEDTYQGHGTRKDIMEGLINLRPSIVRWPGGCIGEVYRWKAGIGPIDKRPATKKYHASVRSKEDPSWEPNGFGTDEFIQFCGDVGASPMLTINIGYDIEDDVEEFLQEALDWIEYCNGDSTTKYGALRKANGHAEPYNVRYWGLGNEPWEMTAEEYAQRYLKFVKAIKKKYPDVRVSACGGYAYDIDWNREVLKLAGSYIDSLNIHYYCQKEDYVGTVNEPLMFEKHLSDLAQLIVESTPNKNVKFSILEWNSNSNWKDASELKQGLYAAGFLNMVERQSSILEHAIVWPALRRVQSSWNHPSDQGLIWFDNHQTYSSPTGLAFQLYSQNYAPTMLQCEVDCDSFDAADGNLPYLDAVATRDKDGQTVILKVVNKSATKEIAVGIELEGLSIEGTGNDISISTLNAADIMAENRIDHPDDVCISESTLNVGGKQIVHAFPPHSVTVLRIPAK